MATNPTLPQGWKSGPAYRNDPSKKDYIYNDGTYRIVITTKNNVIVNTTAYDSNNNPVYSQQGTGPITQTSQQVTNLVQSQSQSLQTALNAGAVNPLPGSPTITVGPQSSQFGIPTGEEFAKILTGITTDFGAGDKEPKNYQYPFDAIYDKQSATQDYLQISKYSYNPPYAGSLFSKSSNPLLSGLIRDKPTKEFLGQVLLPIPNNIADSNNVAWADDNMNNLSAAALNLGLNNAGSLGIGAALGALLSAFTSGNPLSGAQKGAGAALYYKLIQEALSSGNNNAKTIGTAAGASRVLSMAGFQISPESILARGAGVIPNSNLELLFNAPTIREFTFQYRLSPRSQDEASEVKHIIKFFKRGMSPKKQNSSSGSGGASYFLGTPNVFNLTYRTSGRKEIQGVNKIKTCAMTGFSVNYAADGSWAAYDEGQPVSYILNMSFKELEPVYDIDYDLKDSTVGY